MHRACRHTEEIRSMKSTGFWIVVWLLAVATAQQVHAQAATTFILVRHAEKESGSKDPALTPAGQQRAERLAHFLSRQAVQAVYSSNYQRTRQTAAPLALMKNLSIQTYDPARPEEARSMQREFPGATIVVVGHSNTIPKLANYLLGKDLVADFTDDEYDNLLIITVPASGKEATLTRLVF